mmetsp:Transcript_3353/g.4134  ORF Transcript_3353/g.4134 Transcript_3353/m.4134 type:complete len:81 (-) Transcript_3353:48-290(-)
MLLLNAKVGIVNALAIYNCTQGVRIENSAISSLTNSSFSKLGSSVLLRGGAIYSISSNVSISQSSFESNSAVNGGAIHSE